MRIPLSWLNDTLADRATGAPKPLGAETVRETLTRVGLEVESLEYSAPGLETVVVGQIVAIEPHPNADKLRICQTDIGEASPLQIVTGAANVQLNDKIPVALVGSNLPGDKKIEAAKLRGVESFGMYCSLAELGLPPGADGSEGVLVLPADTPIGSPIAAAMKLGELVVDIAVTANRPDLLSVEGVARELAVARPELALKPRAPKPAETVLTSGPVKLGAVDTEGCPLYLGLNLAGVKVGPSPEWLVKRLDACGMRAINNVVDVSNYVMLLTGQPTHAFDAAKIKGGEIRVRRAAEGETLKTLDGVERKLLVGDLVIADAERALVVAGVMGGQEAEVDATTTDLFLECAYFEPSGVRRTGRRLGLSTESSYRFERGVDPLGTERALGLFRDLLLELAGGEVTGGIQTTRKGGFPANQAFGFRLDAIERILGMSVPNPDVERILMALGFEMARHTDGVFELNSYDVTAPGWRLHDVSREVDLVEEVARHWGYDRIPTVLPAAVERPEQPALTLLERRARAIAIGLGLSEVMTKSLTTPEAEQLAGVRGAEHVHLADPLKEMAVLRTSLLPSLLEVLRYNRYQGHTRLGIFEVGRTYHGLRATGAPTGETQHAETLWVGGAVMGSVWEGLWLPEQTPEPLAADFFYAKGLVEAIFDRLEVEGELSFRQAEALPGLHPGRAAEILLAGELVGQVGEVHPQVVKDYDLPPNQRASAWLLDLSALALRITRKHRYSTFSRQPAMLRDLAVVVPETLTAADALATIREAGGDLLERVTMFDRFAGGQLPPGMVSLGFSLVYRSPERTLTTGEVEPVHQRIVDQLQARFGATLRA